MISNVGKLAGTGEIKNPDGTVIEFTLESAVTLEEAEALQVLIPKEDKENK
jgi:hypothetical protein